MMTFKITYKFKNGVTADFTIQNSKENPIAKCEWSCAFNKDNIEPLMNEYVNKCVPFVYQQIADFTGEVIMWIDKHLYYPEQVFRPSVKVKN